MGFVTTSTASGQGSLSLGGLQSVTEVAAHVITPATYATFTGVSGIQRLHQQGWIGLGGTPGAGPLAGLVVITWWMYLDMETFDYQRDQPFFGQVDTLYWDIHDAGVMYLEVDWP